MLFVSWFLKQPSPNALVLPACITLSVTRFLSVVTSWNGWKPLSEALGGQKVTMHHVVGDGNTVMMKWFYEVQHKGTFVGAPATNNTITWEEVGIAHFNDDSKIENMWFMCEELKLAVQIGYELNLK